MAQATPLCRRTSCKLLPQTFISSLDATMFATLIFLAAMATAFSCKLNNCTCIGTKAICQLHDEDWPHFTRIERSRIRTLYLTGKQEAFAKMICILFPRIVQLEGVCAPLECLRNSCRYVYIFYIFINHSLTM